jgi:O-antigen/teichoic acid export membrane protein
VYKKSFRLSLLGSIPMTILAGSMGVYYLLNQNSVLGVGMFIIGALAPFIQPAFLYGNYLEGKKDFRRLAIFGILLNATQAVLLIGTMYVTKDPLLFLASYLGGNIVAGIVFYFYVRSIYKPNELVNADFNSLAMHFSAMNILSTVSQQIDKLLVFHYLGAAQLALYSFAIALPEQAKTAINSVSTIAFPKFAERPLKEIMPNFWHRMRWFSGALVLAALGYILLAPYLFQLFFPTYGDAVIYSQVFAISIIFLSNTIPPTLLQAHAANKELYLFNVVTPLFQILALCILIPQFGLFGIIAARIVGRAFNLVLGAYLVRHYALTEQG